MSKSTAFKNNSGTTSSQIPLPLPTDLGGTGLIERGLNGQVLTSSGDSLYWTTPGGGTAQGTVTSIQFTVPTFMTITGTNPVTTSGIVNFNAESSGTGKVLLQQQPLINNLTTTGVAFMKNQVSISRLDSNYNSAPNMPHQLKIVANDLFTTDTGCLYLGFDTGNQVSYINSGNNSGSKVLKLNTFLDGSVETSILSSKSLTSESISVIGPFVTPQQDTNGIFMSGRKLTFAGNQTEIVMNATKFTNNGSGDLQLVAESFGVGNGVDTNFFSTSPSATRILSVATTIGGEGSCTIGGSLLNMAAAVEFTLRAPVAAFISLTEISLTAPLTAINSPVITLGQFEFPTLTTIFGKLECGGLPTNPTFAASFGKTLITELALQSVLTPIYGGLGIIPTQENTGKFVKVAFGGGIDPSYAFASVGTVTSVGLAVPSCFQLDPTVITDNGQFLITYPISGVNTPTGTTGLVLKDAPTIQSGLKVIGGTDSSFSTPSQGVYLGQQGTVAAVQVCGPNGGFFESTTPVGVSLGHVFFSTTGLDLEVQGNTLLSSSFQQELVLGTGDTAFKLDSIKTLQIGKEFNRQLAQSPVLEIYNNSTDQTLLLSCVSKGIAGPNYIQHHVPSFLSDLTLAQPLPISSGGTGLLSLGVVGTILTVVPGGQVSWLPPNSLVTLDAPTITSGAVFKNGTDMQINRNDVGVYIGKTTSTQKIELVGSNSKISFTSQNGLDGSLGSIVGQSDGLNLNSPSGVQSNFFKINHQSNIIDTNSGLTIYSTANSTSSVTLKLGVDKLSNPQRAYITTGSYDLLINPTGATTINRVEASLIITTKADNYDSVDRKAITVESGGSSRLDIGADNANGISFIQSRNNINGSGMPLYLNYNSGNTAPVVCRTIQSQSIDSFSFGTEITQVNNLYFVGTVGQRPPVTRRTFKMGKQVTVFYKWNGILQGPNTVEIQLSLPYPAQPDFVQTCSTTNQLQGNGLYNNVNNEEFQVVINPGATEFRLRRYFAIIVADAFLLYQPNSDTLLTDGLTFTYIAQ
jgi:hypothetical protein